MISSSLNVVLVGFMGCGKSSVGRALAERLGREFLDTDLIVERALGKSIGALFAEEGEAAFRAAEREAVRGAAAQQSAVIATGGGALGDPANLAALRAGGVLVWLAAQPAAILDRVGAAADRPLLAGADDPRAAVEQLLAQRTPYYSQADHALDTTGLSIEAIVEQLCAVLPSLFRARLTKS
jgi:shikimate kinase